MTVPYTPPVTLVNNTLADATQVMSNFTAITAALNGAAASGANNDITALNGLTTPLAPSEGGTQSFAGGTASGTNTIIVAGTVPANYSLVAGNKIVFIAGGTNTAAATLQVGATGALAVVRKTPSGLLALTGGEIVSGIVVEVTYDGTQYQLGVSTTPVGGFGPLTNLGAAATTDLGLVPSHNVNITGAATITSFGSSAVTAFPVYHLLFPAGVTLTHNPASLILPGGANIVTAANDYALAVYLGSGNWQVAAYQRAAVSPTTVPVVRVVQTSGSGNYTVPSVPPPRQLFVRMVGGGGGGGANNTGGTAATAGGASSFGQYTANGGGAAANGNTTTGVLGGAASGTGSNGTGGATNVNRFTGAAGRNSLGLNLSAGGSQIPGADGADSVFGGRGRGGDASGVGTQAGNAAATNSGSGGGGAGQSGQSLSTGGGGGAGEYVELIYNAPTAGALLPFTVGTAGAGGGSGNNAGGAGAAGIIIIEERY